MVVKEIFMEQMTDDEIRQFLTEPVRTAKLATVRPDGRPHVAPIWYVLDADGNLYFNTWHTSVKGRNIQHDPRVMLSVDDEKPPFAFVLIEGRAEILDVTPDERVKWAGKIGGRYMGAARAEEFGKRNGVEGEFLVRVKPDKIIAQKNLSD